MADETKDQNLESQVDPWAAAFATLAEEQSAAPEGNTDEAGEQDNAAQPAEDNATDAAEPATMGVAGGDDAGELPTFQPPAGEDGESAITEAQFSEDEVEQAIKDYQDTWRNQAINEVGKAFLDQNVMHNERGQLGAYLEHPEIMKRDSNGVPTFWNPETGKQFTGDNPRAQAREWIDDYNKELVQVFEQQVNNRVKQLEKEADPIIQTIKFAPKFEKLDSVRQAMMDSIIQDYEVTDENGNVVGYSCNLESVLAQVNRQISNLQANYKRQNQQQNQNLTSSGKPKGTSPVTDMKSHGSAEQNPANPPKFNSIAEAMEWEQDQLLKKARSKK